MHGALNSSLADNLTLQLHNSPCAQVL